MVNMRPFNSFEQENIKFLVNHNVKFTQVEVTSTGLKKGILDSTTPMRAYFLENGIHDYSEQQQGTEHKVVSRAVILTDTTKKETRVSFYRPNTKKGDPRMWIYGLGSFSKASDIHVLFKYEDALCSVNITRIDIEKCFASPIITPLQEIIKAIYIEGNVVSEELLARFRSVRGQWFESEVAADTGIGRTIESFLGISMNSDKTPDYKGIELKSHRDKRRSRKNVLFTQTPDWDISSLKSGRQIVERYGYYTEERKEDLSEYRAMRHSQRTVSPPQCKRARRAPRTPSADEETGGRGGVAIDETSSKTAYQAPRNILDRGGKREKQRQGIFQVQADRAHEESKCRAV